MGVSKDVIKQCLIGKLLDINSYSYVQPSNLRRCKGCYAQIKKESQLL